MSEYEMDEMEGIYKSEPPKVESLLMETSVMESPKAEPFQVEPSPAEPWRVEFPRDEFLPIEVPPEGLEQVGPDPVEELREELAAAGVESRRTARRQMEVLKEFGGAIHAVGNMVRDIHAAARESAKPRDNGAEEMFLPLVEMADRISRTASAFAQQPSGGKPWWPGASAAFTPWQTAWASQKDALFILCSHMEALLTKAGLERISAIGGVFDPVTMSAVEVVTDPAKPDHTVVAELMSGWREIAGGRVVRPTHVRVSRIS